MGCHSTVVQTDADDPVSGCHITEIDTQFREDNDNPFAVDEETQLLNALQLYWNPCKVDGLTPYFYLYEQSKTHDMANGPFIVVTYGQERRAPVGIGYTANSIHVPMNIEFHTLTRPQLFKMKEHIFNILNYIRKRPFMDYDLILDINGKRIDANPGNFVYAYDLTLVDLIKPIHCTRWE